MKNVVLRAEKLCKTYGKGDNCVRALDDVSLDVYEGEMLAILGNSGSGKSTLLNMLGGMDRFDSGSVAAGDLELGRLNDKGLTKYRKDKIGFVFQSFNLIAELSARENVSLTADRHDPGIVDRMLELVGLSHKADSYPPQLSGGQQQRISIARALAKNPELLLCDEPTGALDSETGKMILVCLEKLVREHGKTVVIVTHNKEITKMSDRYIVMKNGRILETRENPSILSANEIEW